MSNKSSISIPASGRERLRRRGDARRLEILRAAGRIFRQRGYSQAGMRDIAAAADISSGNLYHYFRGKHEILYFCQDRTLDTLLQALASTQGNGGSALERLREVLTAHVHTILDD
ncbi:MAG: helix-turn-helix domain containing protein, partial [Acidobacteria bacterium]|nr:helix-turn-helix domain containing protein [Acidobacteriota bacterium]